MRQAQKPALSVLMPVYNTGRYLAAAVDSILCQSFEDFELIIIDDGSTDHSVAILRALARRDRRIRLIVRANKGLVDTRNELLQEACGGLVAWADSDDQYAHSRLQKQMDRFRDDPALVALGSGWVMVDPEGLPIHRFGFPADHSDIRQMMMDLDNAMWFPTVMMRRQTALDVGGFRHPFVIAEDYDLHLRLSEGGKVANLPDQLLFYRQHFGSTVNSKRWQAATYSALARDLAHERQAAGSDRLQRGERVDLEFPPPASAADNELHIRSRWAWTALMSGYIDTARKHALVLIKQYPLSQDSWKLLACAFRGF